MGESPVSLKKLEEKVVRYFCQRPANFPEGRPYNCTESVLLALSEYFEVRSDLIPRIATAIGAGVSLNGLLCGSVSGVALIMGIKFGRDKKEESPEQVWNLMSDYLRAFQERFGHMNCRELTGLDLKTPKGLKEYFATVYDYQCVERVKFATRKAAELFG
ncbi:MAG: C-GCAxxG-C-C family protein [bacterium]